MKILKQDMDEKKKLEEEKAERKIIREEKKREKEAKQNGKKKGRHQATHTKNEEQKIIWLISKPEQCAQSVKCIMIWTKEMGAG